MKSKSFTLIELLVVIVIIGILAGVIVVSTSSAINKANFAKAQAFSSTVQNELLNDLVSEWTFDEPEKTGRVTKDTWGNNDGTVTGATYKTKTDGVCVYGGCYLFNGTTDYINCGNTYNYERSNNVTVSAWIKSNGTQENGNGGIVADVFGEFNKNRILLTNNNEIYAQFYINNVQSNFLSTKIIKTENWNFIVYTYDGSKEKIYINSEVDEKANSGNVRTGVSGGIIGLGQSNSPFYHFNGLIDDVRIYNRALSSAQIKQNYIAGLDSLLANGNISNEEYNERINSLALY